MSHDAARMTTMKTALSQVQSRTGRFVERGLSMIGSGSGRLAWLVCFAALALSSIAWLAGYRGWAANGSVLVWSLGLLTLVVACCAVPALLLGLTGTLRLVLSAVAILNASAVSFTGFTYPVYSMATAAKVWSLILPFTYFYEIQHQQWNTGAPFAASAASFAVLWSVFIAVPLAIGIPLLAKRCRDPEGWGKR